MSAYLQLLSQMATHSFLYYVSEKQGLQLSEGAIWYGLHMLERSGGPMRQHIMTENVYEQRLLPEVVSSCLICWSPSLHLHALGYYVLQTITSIDNAWIQSDVEMLDAFCQGCVVAVLAGSCCWVQVSALLKCTQTLPTSDAFVTLDELQQVLQGNGLTVSSPLLQRIAMCCSGELR